MKNEVINYNVTDGIIAQLKESYLGITEYKELVPAIREVRKIRLNVEDKRKELKADALEWGRKVDSEAKRITALLLEIENPLQAAKKSIEDEKARIAAEKVRLEQERIAKIKKRIDQIKDFALQASLLDASALSKEIGELDEHLSSDHFDYAEFSAEAGQAKIQTMGRMRELLDIKNKQEAEARALREQLEAHQAELAAAKLKHEHELAEAHEAQRESEKMIKKIQAQPPCAPKPQETFMTAEQAELEQDAEAVVDFVVDFVSGKNPPPVAVSSRQHKGIITDGKMITITAERYEELLESEKLLNCLQSAGVDNWEGYNEALDLLIGE